MDWGSGYLSSTQPSAGQSKLKAKSVVGHNMDDGGGGAEESKPTANGSSKDFVRKLFTMLEEPSYSSVVRWSDTGDSFVVLDPSEFTKIVLPRHFKHSNFASFVRQLNKYDFHKVRVMGPPAQGSNGSGNAGSETTPYGDTSWEFKHPDFQLHNKDQIDNIKRKVVSTKKAPAIQDSPQVARLESQVEELKAKLTSVQADYRLAVHSISRLEQTVSGHEEYLRQIFQALQASGLNHKKSSLSPGPSGAGMETTIRNGLANGNATGNGHGNGHGNGTGNGTGNSIVKNNANAQVSNNHPQGDQSQPAMMAPAAAIPPPMATESAFSALLVEDDETCVRIARRFLVQYGCDVDVANDGLEAVNRAQASTYDIIMIEAVLPVLDGISATELIRNFNPTTPIVAFTATVIDHLDAENFYRRGITSVITKPFTKELMYQVLDKYLGRNQSGSSTQIQEPMNRPDSRPKSRSGSGTGSGAATGNTGTTPGPLQLEHDQAKGPMVAPFPHMPEVHSLNLMDRQGFKRIRYTN